MSWRAESQFVTQQQENEKNFMKIAKKIRDIGKLELQAHVEANQQQKLQQKAELLNEIAEVKVDRSFWSKFDDIWALLPPKAQQRIEFRKAQADAEERRKQEEKEERKQRSLNHVEEDVRRAPELNFVVRHERPVTDMCYDEQTGFLYSSSKDKAVVRWDVQGHKIVAHTTLCGHEGAVWCVDVHRGEVVTGGADGLLIFWSADPNAGRGKKEKIQQPHKVQNYGGIIKGLRVHDAGICLYTDKFGPKNPAHIACLSRDDPTQVIWKTTDIHCKINQLIWGPVGQPKIFTAHDDGNLNIWAGAGDGEGGGKLMKSVTTLHDKAIISMNTHKNFILTASSDMTVKAINSGSKDLPVCFHAKANRPLRAVAAWDFPEEKCFAFVYGGGRDPKDVTTSYLLPDEFDFYQSYLGESQSTIMTKNGSAGPLHRLIWVNPLNKVFAASEDGEVKMWDAETLHQMR
ncbi:unnamed protein product [Amoebophrya sp. A120]|nr:unnamed protein product [Amoebophrya sp. A120]|eukprot:GSA120T00016963001.1